MSSSAFLRTKQRLVGALFLLWALPALQAGLNMKIFRPSLAGFEVKETRPAFSWAGLLAGTYPGALERFATQKIGFREWLVRPRNQLAFSWFGTVTTREVTVGKNGQLFEHGTITAYCGHIRQVPAPEVTQRVQLMRALQDSLARRGKLLVFATAPAKVSFAPELLPDSTRTGWGQSNNYTRYTRALRAAGVNLLDFGPVFRAWKSRSRYPLFPPGGTHWSGYGVTRAADTLCRYLEEHGRFRLPTVRQTGLEISTTPRYTDDDLARLLNLLWAPPSAPLAYPTLAFDPPRAGQVRPRLLLLGDSFGWSFIEFYPYLQHLFAPESHFWYYASEVVWPKPARPTFVADLNLRQQLAAHDVVLFLFTEHNLIEFDREFSARALAALAAGR